MNRAHNVNHMLNDLREALRTLRRSPGFAASAILALALGIGANTAVFSIVYVVLLKPLPYAEPDRLVRLYESNPAQGIERGDLSPGTYVDWRARSRKLEGIAVYTTGEGLWSFGDQQEVVKTSAVSPILFSLLRVQPVRGRTFRAEADQPPPDGDGVEVILSYALWQRRFAGSPAVLGQAIRIEGRVLRQIVGVMPRGFAFPDETAAWTNLTFRRPISQGERQVRYYQALGRLAPGVTLADAAAELTTISSQLEVEQPPSNAGWGAQVEPLADASTRGSRAALLVLWAAVGGVLLIGCANVANLLLARASARRQETAVRVALGAGTWRLVRYCFTEALVLVTLGTLSGLVLGNWITHALVRLAPPDLPRLSEVGLNGALLTFAICAALVTTALTGLAPALYAARAQHHGLIRLTPRSVIESGGSVRAWLIAGEVAVVVVLLTSSMLLVRSFAQLRGVDLGFASEHALSVETRWPVGRFATSTRRPWYLVSQGVDGLIAAVRSIPGVDAVGLVSDLPLRGDPSAGSMWRPEAPGASGTRAPASARDQWKADISIVTGGYFEALGIPFQRGRNFSDGDRFTEAQLLNPESPRTAAAVINTAFSARYFPDEDPIGKMVVLFDDETFGGTRTIIGVVADVRSRAIADPGAPMIFLPHAQHPDVFRPTLVVRSSLPPRVLAPAIRARIHAYDPQLLVLRTRPMQEVVSGALSRPRFHLLLVGSFAIVALGLAAVGIYGVAAMSVTRRTREIGIRMALGAQAGDVLGRVLAQGMWPVAFGSLAGLAGAAGVTRALRSMLFGVTALDTVSFALAPLVLAAVALLACYLPARRALRVDPIVALREE